MNLLDKFLWKPATDIKPEDLMGKQCKGAITGYPLIILKVRGKDAFCAWVDKDGYCDGYIDLKYIFWLDESPEAVKEAMKPLYRKIKDYVISLDTPDNTVYQENSLLIQSCFAKALELIEEF